LAASEVFGVSEKSKGAQVKNDTKCPLLKRFTKWATDFALSARISHLPPLVVLTGSPKSISASCEEKRNLEMTREKKKKESSLGRAPSLAGTGKEKLMVCSSMEKKKTLWGGHPRRVSFSERGGKEIKTDALGEPKGTNLGGIPSDVFSGAQRKGETGTPSEGMPRKYQTEDKPTT